MPVKPGHYCWKKPNDVQINYFLDFSQHGGVMQDVASGTFSAKLSSSRKTSIPNAIRMVPKDYISVLVTSKDIHKNRSSIRKNIVEYFEELSCIREKEPGWT